MKVEFTMKIFSVHPSYDNMGNEYICVEFGYKPPKIPAMVPSTVPKEVSEAIQMGREMVKVIVPPHIQAQRSQYSKRLILFLNVEEWERLHQKYTVGDVFEAKLMQDGSIEIKKT